MAYETQMSTAISCDKFISYERVPVYVLARGLFKNINKLMYLSSLLC